MFEIPVFQALNCRESRSIAPGMSFNLIVVSALEEGGRKSSVVIKTVNPWYVL